MSEELHEKQRNKTIMQEEVETLKDMLRSEKQTLEELSYEYNELRTLCEEKESALQVLVLLTTSIMRIKVLVIYLFFYLFYFIF